MGTEMVHLMELPNPDEGMQRPEHGGRDRHFCVGVGEGGVAELRETLDTAGAPPPKHCVLRCAVSSAALSWPVRPLATACGFGCVQISMLALLHRHDRTGMIAPARLNRRQASRWSAAHSPRADLVCALVACCNDHAVRACAIVCQPVRAGIKYTASQSGRPAIFFRDPDENTLEVVETADWR